MSKLKIKISDIQHLTDARYFSSREVDYLGFDRLTIPSNDIKLIKEWIQGPQIVSEFVGNNCFVDINSLLDEMPTDVLHFDAFVDHDVLQSFNSYEVMVDVDLQLDQLEKIKSRLSTLDGLVDYFIIKSFDKLSEISAVLTDFSSKFPCFLDIAITTSEDVDLIKKINPEGIILRGSSEERIGVKSFDELDEILDLIETKFS